MVYILTGIAKAGKSLVSYEIKKRYNLSVFSTDYIMMMVHHGNKTLDLDIYASDSTVAHVIEPYVKGLIQTLVDHRVDYLIEGVHFNTSFAKRLLETFPNDVKLLYLGYKTVSTKDKVAEIFQYKDTMDNPWIFHHPDESVEEIVAYMIDESNRIYNECKELKLPYFEVTDINTQLDDIIKELIGDRKSV